MRRQAILNTFVVIFLGIGSAACTGTIDDLLTYEREVEKEVTVPGVGIGVGQNDLVRGDVIPSDFGDIISDSLNESFNTEDLEKDAVESLKVLAIRLEVTNAEEDPPLRDLSFLSFASFALSSDTVEPVVVGQSETAVFDEPGLLVYDFPMTDAELVDVLKGGDSITLEATVEFDTDEPPVFDTDIRLSAVLQVIANPLGAL